MKQRTALLVCLLGWLAGCPSATTVGPAPRTSNPAGTFVHGPSRFEFPETFGKFRRVAITQYDDEGRDIGVGYNLDEDLRIVLTLYVYPPGRDASGDLIPLARQFEGERANILRYHIGAQSSAPWTPPQTENEEPSPGHAVAFRYEEDFAGGRNLLTSLLYLFEYDGWIVKYRITFPAAQQEEAGLVSEVFVSAFPWRGVP